MKEQFDLILIEYLENLLEKLNENNNLIEPEIIQKSKPIQESKPTQFREQNLFDNFDDEPIIIEPKLQENKIESSLETTNEIINEFKTFYPYQFLRRFKGESFRGEYDFNFSKKERIEANLQALKLTQIIFLRMDLLQNKNVDYKHLNITDEELNLKEFQHLESDILPISKDEQAILAQYSGFGGLRDLFFKNEFKDLNNELKNLVGQKLYGEIENSSFNAYYTPKEVIENIYYGLENLGVPNFNGHKILALEPSCGIGRFIAKAPSNYEFQAVEKDTISATIAKMLHPSTKIYNQAFETVSFDNEFDVIVGNPPFDNQLKIADYRSAGNGFSIHNYFAIHSSELLKDYGIMSFVISSYFLDSKTNEHRKLLSKAGNLLSAVRLPNSVFKNSNTNVLTDVFYYQRLINKDNDYKNMGKDFVDLDVSPHVNDLLLNRVFANDRDNILGIPKSKLNTRFGDEKIEMFVEDDKWQERFIYKINKINKNVFQYNAPFVRKINEIDYSSLSADELRIISNLNNGNIFFMNSKIYFKRKNNKCEEAYFEMLIANDLIDTIDEKLIISFETKTNSKNSKYKSFLTPYQVELAKTIIDYRDLLEKHLQNELNFDYSQKSVDILFQEKETLKKLRNDILSFAKIDSLHTNAKDAKEFRDILNLDKLTRNNILATEIVKKAKNKAKIYLAPILTERINKPIEKIPANTNEEALQKTINDKGYIDENTLASYRPSIPLNEILQDLCDKQIIFYNIDKNFDNQYDYVLNSQFLSGNVKAKYNLILDLINKKSNNEFMGFDKPHLDLEKTASALYEVFPNYVNYEDIELTFGSKFIPINIYKDFIKQTFLNDEDKESYFNFHRDLNGIYYFEAQNGILDDSLLLIYKEDGYTFAFRQKSEFVERILNGKSLEVSHMEKDENGKDKQIKELIPTKEALEKTEIIKDKFIEFCLCNPKYRKIIEQAYNNTINVFNNKKIDYENFLLMPNLNKDIKLMNHQKNAIFKGIINKSLLLDHEVGAGKTLAGIGLAMEQVRMGLVKKVLILVPNHLLNQWANEFEKAYPNDINKLLVGNLNSQESRNSRKEFLNQIKYGNENIILMKHSTFNNLNLSMAFEKVGLEKYLETLKTNYENFKNNNDRENATNLSKKIKTLEEKLIQNINGLKYDDEIMFEDLNIDCLIVDEAHEYKNLQFISEQKNIRGMPNSTAKKSLKLYSAVEFVRNNNGKIYFLTGTPMSNSLCEMFIMQKYIQPHILESTGLANFDNWLRTFGRIVDSEELDSSGVNYKIVSRISNFINTPELMNMYLQNADIVTTKEIQKTQELFIPELINEIPSNVISPRSENIANYIGIEDEMGNFNKGSIVYRMEHLSQDPKKNNMLACTTDARKAALDFRLIDPSANDYEESKINRMCQNVLKHYNDENYPKNTQLIFCDLGVSKKMSQNINVNEIQEYKKYKSIDEKAMALGLEKRVRKNDDNIFNEDKVYYVEYELNSNGNKTKDIAKIYNPEDLMEIEVFDVYSDILKKLVKLGIPQKEIAFIGDANTDNRKEKLFEKMNNGEVRVLIGSTFKMGTGTNVQKRGVALHEVDCPWRPSDLLQRQGRFIRQGNIFFDEEKNKLLNSIKDKNLNMEEKNKFLKENIKFKMHHYRYATEQTYDARMFQVNEQKLKPIIQLKELHFKNQRVFEGIDGELANIAEMKAVATGNPFILEKHLINKLLNSEKRYFEQWKKSILTNERQLEILNNKQIILENENKFLSNNLNNKNFESENYKLESFGKLIDKKDLKDEIEREINKNIKEIFLEPKNEEFEIFKANDLKVILRGEFNDLHRQFLFKGTLIKDGLEYQPDNMIFKMSINNNLFYDIPTIHSFLTKTKNALNKAQSVFEKNNDILNQIKKDIEARKEFLNENKLDNYCKKNLLETLKNDERNINTIMNLIRENKKEGIKIMPNDPEIKDLLPKYKSFFNQKGKFIEPKKQIENNPMNNYIKALDNNMKKLQEAQKEWQNNKNNDKIIENKILVEHENDKFEFAQSRF